MIFTFLWLMMLFVTEATSDQTNFVSTFEQVDVDSVDVTDKTNTSFKTVCYYPVSNKFNKSATDPIPKDLNPMLCSHLIFIPTYIDQYNRVIPSVPSDVDLYQTAIPAMRKQNPKLIIMISNGGNISAVMQSVKNTSEYVNSTVAFLRKYDIDGIDLDWEFPQPSQYQNFSRVLSELKKTYEQEAVQTKRPRLLLSAAVLTAEALSEKIYDFDTMKRTLDFVNMMGYDYHGPGGLFTRTDYNCPLPALASSANFWASKVGKDKLMVGFPFYCHAYKLLSPFMHGYHAFSDGKGECDFGKYTCACLAINNKNATSVFDGTHKVPYCYYDNQWVSYENVDSIVLKTKWILDNKFVGLMVFEMTSDDISGVCDGKTKFPLMNAILQTIYLHRN